MNDEERNGWLEYRKLVLQEITDLKMAKAELEKCVSELKLEVIKLKTSLKWYVVLAGGTAAGAQEFVGWILQ